MMKYKIPDKLKLKFLAVGQKNYSKINPSDHVETLALLIGQKSSDEEITVTHLVFPDQVGQTDSVEEKGKPKYFQ